MVEEVHVQTLVPDTVVEGFNESVAPGLTGWSEMNAKLLRSEFFYCFRNELGSVTAP
jgi:hypothetical protein